MKMAPSASRLCNGRMPLALLSAKCWPEIRPGGGVLKRRGASPPSSSAGAAAVGLYGAPMPPGVPAAAVGLYATGVAAPGIDRIGAQKAKVRVTPHHSDQLGFCSGRCGDCRGLLGTRLRTACCRHANTAGDESFLQCKKVTCGWRVPRGTVHRPRGESR